VLLHQLEFFPEPDAEWLATVPANSAVFVLRSSEGNAEPYVSKTSNLRRRLARLLGRSEGVARKLNLRDRVRRIEWTPTGSDFEATLLLYEILRREFPRTYDKRLRLRFAPLIKVILDNPYPRVSVTTRIASLKAKAEYYGPFAARVAAEKFASDALDLFKMRRCVEELHPDPAFPGCIYSEMKMCLAPCFKGCTDEAYGAEVGRVREFLQSAGNSLVREIAQMRDEASANLDFENAAAMHARLEKVKAATTQLPEIVRRVDQLSGVLVQPSAEPESVALFKIEAGMLSGPASLNVGAQAEAEHLRATPRSMESRIAGVLESVPGRKPHSAGEWMEHLAILKRWYYRSLKTGELFLANADGELPMRRLVRGVSRVFRGEKPAADLSETAGEYWKFRAGEAGIR
jgi:excinuclease UvrABC nuclease subunit